MQDLLSQSSSLLSLSPLSSLKVEAINSLDNISSISHASNSIQELSNSLNWTPQKRLKVKGTSLDIKDEINSDSEEANNTTGELTDDTIPSVWCRDTSVLSATSQPSENDWKEREFFIRCVVIGAANTQKRSLIRSFFQEEPLEENFEKIETKSDFIAKTAVNQLTTRKYHFWSNTVGSESVTEKLVWKTYYKWANAFIFVYDPNDRASFELLEEAVKEVLEVAPREKFHGILVGNKKHANDSKVVDFKEGVNFCFEYGLEQFVETSVSMEMSNPQVMPLLDGKMKLTFEAI